MKPHQAGPAATGPARIPHLSLEMVLSLDARTEAPGVYERAALRDWVAQWRSVDPDRTVVIGCSTTCDGRSAGRRAARLMALRQVVLDSGVAADHIRFNDAFQPASPAPAPASPAASGPRVRICTEVAWLKAVARGSGAFPSKRRGSPAHNPAAASGSAPARPDPGITEAGV